MVNQSRPFRLHPPAPQEQAGASSVDAPTAPPGNARCDDSNNHQEASSKAAGSGPGHRLPMRSADAGQIDRHKKPGLWAGSLIHSALEWWAVQGSNL